MSHILDYSLTLNKFWTPIGVCPNHKAFTAVCADRARILHPDTYELCDMKQWLNIPVKDGEPFIRNVDHKVKVPKIIVSRHTKVPARKVVFNRKNLWKRDNFACQYCGVKPPYDEVTIDHVVPRSQGGQTTFVNTVLACLSCNKKKNDRTPEQAGMKLRRAVMSKDGIIKIEYYHRPEYPKWSPIYLIGKKKIIPKEWNQYLQHMIDEMYWHIELEP